MTENDLDPSPHVRRWSGEAFLAQAGAWVGDAARAAGISLTGQRTQPHVRPWSSAVRFGAEGGDLWLKVNGAGTRHEGALVAAVADLEPGLVPGVVAVEGERGWFLTRDAGPMLREVLPPESLWDHWEAILVRYAEAQIRLADHANAVLASGLPEVTPRTLPDQLGSLVERLTRMPPDEGGLTAGERGKLDELLDDYVAWCAELAASGIPSSVQHDDLHSGNICWGGSPETSRIIDWGDASWGFPLATMLCTLNSLAWHAGCDRDDPRVLRMRDAYLRPFTRYADPPDLVRYVHLARRTGCVARALSYQAALLDEPVATHRAYDFPVRGWLLEVLEM